MLQGQVLPPPSPTGLTARNSGGQLCNRTRGFAKAGQQVMCWRLGTPPPPNQRPLERGRAH